MRSSYKRSVRRRFNARTLQLPGRTHTMQQHINTALSLPTGRTPTTDEDNTTHYRSAFISNDQGDERARIQGATDGSKRADKLPLAGSPLAVAADHNCYKAVRPSVRPLNHGLHGSTTLTVCSARCSKITRRRYHRRPKSLARMEQKSLHKMAPRGTRDPFTTDTLE